MFRILGAITLLLSMGLAQTSAAGHAPAPLALKPYIFISSFHFAGRGAPTPLIRDPYLSQFAYNSSIPAAEFLKRSLETQGYRVETCTVPSLFDTASERVLECIAKFPETPDMVVSLGAGGFHIDTGANNFAIGGPDFAGVKKTGELIDLSLPARIEFSLPGGRSFLDVRNASGARVPLSPTPGTYTCNNLAFNLGHVFAAKGIPYFFVHVPRFARTESELVKATDQVELFLKEALPVSAR